MDVMPAPYVGLRYFEADDQHLFYGREEESAMVRALWVSHRLVVLFGPSGVGKTSLLHAGVLPLLSADEADVLPMGRVSQGTAHPTTWLPNVNPYTFALLSAWSRASSPASLHGLTLTAFLRDRPALTNKFGEQVPIYGAIDQFEELFADLPHRAQYREEFIAELGEACEAVPRLRLLISIREEFAAGLLPYEPQIVAISRDRYPVRPMRPGPALAAVIRPLDGTGCAFAPGVAERLVDDLRTVTITNSLGEQRTLTSEMIEPSHLQMICTALWEGLGDEARLISFDDLARHADIDRALGGYCSGVISEVAAQHGLPASTVWRWLKEQFITELGTRGTVYEGISATAGMENSVARELAAHHLLRDEERAGSRWYELLHDRLIEPIREGNRTAVEEAVPQTRNAVFLRHAESALADGDLANAERYGLEAIRFGAERADPRIKAEAESFLARIAVERNRLAEAESRYRAAVATFDAIGDSRAGGRVLAALGRLLLGHGMAATAVDDLANASVRLPGDVAVRTYHARALTLAGEPTAAISVLNAAVTLQLDHVPALVLRGVLQAEHGSAAAARADLDYAERLDPTTAGLPEVTAARARLASGNS
jgi:tetratricopeptide (TPR) repeat protein